MIILKRKTVVKYLVWILMYMLLMTIAVGSIIYFLNEPGEIYYLASISAIGIGMLVFGTLAFLAIKKYVSRGKSRQTFFKESTSTVIFLSIYSIILIHVFAWLLDLILGSHAQIIMDGSILDYMILSATSVVIGIMFYYIGLIIFNSFVFHFLMGMLVTFIFGSIVGFLNGNEFFVDYITLKQDQPLILLLVQLALTIILGIIARKLVINSVVKI